MQEDLERRQELSAFLQQKRKRLSPAMVGLTPGTRRRTPGLRREEVAQLAGISAGWYTWLEQGRAIKVSTQSLEGIARALQLTPIERLHLFHLAALHPPASVSDVPLSPALWRVLRNQKANPAYIMNWRWDVVASNDAARAVFCDFEQLPPIERNIVYLMFTKEPIRQLVVDWENHAKRILAQFHADYAEYKCDPAFLELIGMLKLLSRQFRTWWECQDVDAKAETPKTLNHPIVGQLNLEQTAYRLEDARSSRLVLYMPLDETTDKRLHHLYRDVQADGKLAVLHTNGHMTAPHTNGTNGVEKSSFAESTEELPLLTPADDPRSFAEEVMN